MKTTRKKGSEIKTKLLLEKLLNEKYLTGGSRQYQIDGLKYSATIRVYLRRNGYIDEYGKLLKPFDVNEMYDMIRKNALHYVGLNKQIDKKELQKIETDDMTYYTDIQLANELKRRGWTLTATRTETL